MTAWMKDVRSIIALVAAGVAAVFGFLWLTAMEQSKASRSHDVTQQAAIAKPAKQDAFFVSHHGTLTCKGDTDWTTSRDGSVTFHCHGESKVDESVTSSGSSYDGPVVPTTMPLSPALGDPSLSLNQYPLQVTVSYWPGRDLAAGLSWQWEAAVPFGSGIRIDVAPGFLVGRILGINGILPTLQVGLRKN